MKKRMTILVLLMLLMISTVSNAESMELSGASDNIEEMIQYIDDHYYVDVDKDQLIMGAYKGIFETLDQHSTYISPATYAEITKQLHGSYVGVGIIVEEDLKGILVKNLYGNSPAESSGLEVGDVITSVNGLSIKQVGYDQALDLLLGEANSEVYVEVYKAKSKRTEKYRLIRQTIDLNPVISEIKENGVGYVRIVDFAETTSEKFAEALGEFENQDVHQIVLDLRDNPGGLMDEALEVIDLLMEEKKVVLRVNTRSEQEVYYSDSEGKDFETVILVNENSASASEIVTGALKYYHKATVVGTNTYGKGTVQNLMDIDMGKDGAYKVTIAEFLLPDSSKINAVGIKPDVYVENYTDLDLDAIGAFAPMVEEKVFEVGEVGLNVFGMEQRLEEMGYEIKVDGVFDKPTQMALLDFQTKHGLAGNGLLDGETINKLNQFFELADLTPGYDYQLEKAMELLAEQ